MTVLTIRAHKRYALRQPVRLAKSGAAPARGLLIELSSEGCRISNLGGATYDVGEQVAIHVDELKLPGRIRWAHDGLAGVRLDDALRIHQLAELIALGRNEAPTDIARYGT